MKKILLFLCVFCLFFCFVANAESPVIENFENNETTTLLDTVPTVGSKTMTNVEEDGTGNHYLQASWNASKKQFLSVYPTADEFSSKNIDLSFKFKLNEGANFSFNLYTNPFHIRVSDGQLGYNLSSPVDYTPGEWYTYEYKYRPEGTATTITISIKDSNNTTLCSVNKTVNISEVSLSDDNYRPLYIYSYGAANKTIGIDDVTYAKYDPPFVLENCSMEDEATKISRKPEITFSFSLPVKQYTQAEILDLFTLKIGEVTVPKDYYTVTASSKTVTFSVVKMLERKTTYTLTASGLMSNDNKLLADDIIVNFTTEDIHKMEFGLASAVVKSGGEKTVNLTLTDSLFGYTDLKVDVIAVLYKGGAVEWMQLNKGLQFTSGVASTTITLPNDVSSSTLKILVLDEKTGFIPIAEPVLAFE